MMRHPIDRRQFLAGQIAAKPGAIRHISSALVLAFPDQRPAIIERISEMPHTEVHGIENGKIIVVLEGASVGEIGERLTTISLMDGVLAANLVFEQLCEPDSERPTA
jgi:periplasmic nitrate reductase NapD